MKKAYSWKVIIILLILFFPVGIYLLYKRFTWDKTATAKNQKGLTVAGWIFVGLAAYYFITGISGGMKNEDGTTTYSTAIIVPLIFVPLGVIFLKTAQKFKRISENAKKYIPAVIKQKQYDLENIASSVGVSYEKATRDLQELLNADYFPGSYINEESHEFVLPINTPLPAQSNDTSAQNKAVKCQNCGANNTILVGRACECIYCGSPIEI